MMPTDLEERLRAAGDQIDRQIALSIHRQRFFAAPRRPWWSLAVAASAGALLVAALVWVTGRDNAGTGPAEPVPTVGDVSSTAPAPTTGPVTAAPTTVASTDAVTTTVPSPPPPPAAIGESVMLGATKQLEAAGFSVVAEISHQADWVADTIGRLRAEGRIGSVVVIQVGTNGQTTTDDLDRIMSYLPVDEVPTVVFLTVRAPGKGWIDGNNERIRSLPSRYPNVQILDWKGLVDSGQIPGMAGDGIHLGTADAKQMYANYIFSMIGRNDLVVAVGDG